MDKRKVALALFFIVCAYGSYSLYFDNIIYWDAYTYEITATNNTEQEYTLQLTSQDLAMYADLAAKLDEASQEGFAMMTFGGDDIYQYEDLLEINGLGSHREYAFLQTDELTYVVQITPIGGMDDDPRYLWASGLALLIAVALIITEIIAYLKSRD